eukprot:gene5063-34858_t
MAPVDVEFLITIYNVAGAALGEGKDAAIAAVLLCAGIPGGDFVGWVIGKVLDRMGVDMSKVALTIAIICEYAKRTDSFKKGIKLQNKCSVCHCKGHNSTNHPAKFDAFLKANRLQGAIDDAMAVADSLS